MNALLAVAVMCVTLSSVLVQANQCERCSATKAETILGNTDTGYETCEQKKAKTDEEKKKLYACSTNICMRVKEKFEVDIPFFGNQKTETIELKCATPEDVADCTDGDKMVQGKDNGVGLIGKQKIWCCNSGDGCNGAGTTIAAMWLSISGVVLALMFKQ